MNLRIRDLREDADLKQWQVAKYLMCDPSLYGKYERGVRDLPLHLAVKLADFYGVTLDYLVGRTREGGPSRPGDKRT
ncbi:MAG: helix-turn-helix domain-containing protein [Christensenellales bacterium]|jgi:transcriptional regulator with XRE-family HTH domain